MKAVFRNIVSRREIRAGIATSYNGTWVYLTLECGHVVGRKGSRAPRDKAKCSYCTESRGDASTPTNAQGGERT